MITPNEFRTPVNELMMCNRINLITNAFVIEDWDNLKTLLTATMMQLNSQGMTHEAEKVCELYISVTAMDYEDVSNKIKELTEYCNAL